MPRATLLDERLDEEVIETTDESTEDLENPKQETVEEQPQEESSIPEKYQGKSVEDLVQMHQELERFSGKQSSEVGELRKIVDDYIKTELEAKAPEPQIEDKSSDIDFFSDPTTAVNRAIENHPKVKEAENYSRQYQQQATLSELRSKHGDMDSILKDPKFAEWVGGSKTRKELFVRADQSYDFDAADELFSLWKERNQIVQQATEVEKQSRKKAIKQASTGAARGSSESSSKKIYRRRDMINLKKEKPARYQEMADEILKAYREGRVK